MSDRFNRLLFEALPIGLAICHLDGRLTYVNEAYASIIGYSVEEALKLTYWQVTPVDYEKQEQQQLVSLTQTGRYGPYEKEYIHKDGHNIPVRLSGVLIRDNDEDMIWSSVEDITISKTTQELKAKTEFLETTFENMADGISMVDADFNIVAFNSRFLELLNLPKDQFHPGDSFESFIRFLVERGEYGSGDVGELVDERIKRARQMENLNFERTTPNGTVLEIRRRSTLGGGFVTLYSDISDRKAVEKALQESEAKFREFAKISSDWFWEMDADLRFTYFSPRNKEITGFDPDIYIGKTRREIRHGSDDDENWKQHLKRLDEHRAFRNFEYDLKIADGQTLTISISGDPVFKADGSFDGYYGTGRDITVRKLAEKKLSESEHQFRSLFHQFPSGVTLEDYSRVKTHIERLASEGVKDFAKYFDQNKDVLKEIIMDIGIVDANDTQIKMFGVNSFEEYRKYEADNHLWSDTSWREFYIGELTSMASGASTYTAELQDVTADGTAIELRCTSRIIKNPANDWSVVISSHEDITARKLSEEQLLQQATIDFVTGLPNRALLFDRLALAMEHARREQRNLGLIFVDLDHFKQVNDSRGHVTGDQLLKSVGQRLSNLIRHEDTVARLGGDEFIILLNDVELPSGPEIVAKKIIDAFVDPFDLEGDKIFATVSLGISIFPDDGEEAETLLQNADAAMYKSKRNGRNTFRFFTPGLNDQAEHHGRIAERLRHALDRGDLELYFQPVVDIAGERLASIEALIRWNDSVLKAVDSEQLIKVAEETGFILPIDKWVLSEACVQVAAWRAGVAPQLQLSVNVSNAHFRSPDLVESVRGALADSGLPAAALTIEITENLLMEDSVRILDRLRKLTAMGVKLALDDFGTGYSSLAYLKKFQVDALKIDQTFIQDIVTNDGDLALVDAIIAMSKSLGLTVVVEGVETPEQLELLQARGCHLIQGFHFSHPLSVDEMTEYLANEKTGLN
ncbi:MAG: EAL domain-containing protein [Rhodospirillaceae bacterium]|nr:EAL domain-containing protein [Rhodospirillaceae bacterium]